MRFHSLAWSVAALLLAISASSGGKQGLSLVAAEETTSTEAASANFTPPEGSEKFAFEAEVHRMLDIVVNSLYQNKDVFLRELISNASDALDKLRLLSLTKPDIISSDQADDMEIRIQYDKEAKTLTIQDTGIGMTKADLVENLGTVARSGTTKFMEALKEKSDSSADVGGMIGQFGVGFYSTFLVSDRVSVASKHPEEDTQYVWESVNGSSDFHIFPDPRGNTLTRGTEITLHLKDDCLDYADAFRLKQLITHYSEFITHPIHLRTTKTETVEIEEEGDEVDEEKKDEEKKEEDELDVSEEEEEEEEKPKKTKEVTTHEWESINNSPAIWARSKDDITDDEYQEFFKLVSKETFSNATSWTHFDAEGTINFKSILYLPSEIPSEWKMGHIQEEKGGLKLYVQKVLISDEFELMPRYLRFVRGVVDSDDLPLNVNRETLQESKIIKIIKKKLVRKAIDMIRELSKREAPEDEEVEAEIDADGNVVESEPVEKEPPYLEWYKKFSPAIKMGVIDDEPNRDRLAKLLRFQTSKSDDKWISLEDYIENMKDWQKEIYFLAGLSLEELQKSKFLERFKEKDVEVIYMTEAVDEYVTQHMRDFNGKKFQDVTGEGVKFNDEDEDLIKRREKAYMNKFKPLTMWLKKLYGSSVMRVMVSKRLGSAPAIVSTSQYGYSANMERIMRAQTFDSGDNFMMQSMKVFEINPRHPIVLKLLEGCPTEEDQDNASFKVSQDVEDAAWIIHGLAFMNGGFPVADVDAHTKRMIRFLQSQFSIDSLELEPEIDPPEEEEEAPEVDLDGLDGINMDDLNLDDMDFGEM